MLNTHLSFDTDILLPKVENPDKDNWKDYTCKVSYNLKLDREEKYSTKRVISKILKLHKNSQYGYRMTKPMTTGGIKEKFDSGSSIKYVAMQTNTNVKITTCFMKGKMLMFTKTSIINLVYHTIYVFCFPEDNLRVQVIYDKHKIEKCFLYQNLTDRDSTSLIFDFIWTLNCQLNEVMINSKIYERLDLSNEFWSQFNVRHMSTENQVGLYKIQSSDYPNIVTIALNPKQYFKIYRGKSFNKKHKGLKRIPQECTLRLMQIQ